MFHFFPAEETFDVDEIGTAFLLNISTPKISFPQYLIEHKFEQYLDI